MGERVGDDEGGNGIEPVPRVDGDPKGEPTPGARRVGDEGVLDPGVGGNGERRVGEAGAAVGVAEEAEGKANVALLAGEDAGESVEPVLIGSRRLGERVRSSSSREKSPALMLLVRPKPASPPNLALALSKLALPAPVRCPALQGDLGRSATEPESFICSDSVRLRGEERYEGELDRLPNAWDEPVFDDSSLMVELDG